MNNMLKKSIETALNKQINAELWSAYLYLSMASYFESMTLKGFATWMWVQTREEVTHAMRLYNHVIERGGRVTLDAIARVPATWKSPLDAFQETYKHEQKVTSLINALVDLSIKEKDHACNTMLQWFVNEQVEEESSADEIAKRLKLIGKDSNGLFILDQELGQRAFTPPVDLKYYTPVPPPA
jgi:ferritin